MYIRFENKNSLLKIKFIKSNVKSEFVHKMLKWLCKALKWSDTFGPTFTGLKNRKKIWKKFRQKKRDKIT